MEADPVAVTARDPRGRWARQPQSNPELVAWAARRLGWRPMRVDEASWDHAESAVARLAAGDGRGAYLKVHRQPRKHRQERFALETWAPALPGAPALLAVHEADPPALLLGELPGTRVDAVDWDGPTRRAIHQAAGEWLRRLHDLPHADADPLAPAAAIEARLEGWSERAAAALPRSTLRWVAERVRAVDLRDWTRVPCHRDFGPRNWLWDATAGLGVIDFEHALPDLWCVDVLRLMDESWNTEPALAEAFWRGYGRRPRSEEAAAAAALRALYALGTVGWAIDHGDTAFEAQGRAVLRRLGAPGTHP